jgi:hypothetical protein
MWEIDNLRDWQVMVKQAQAQSLTHSSPAFPCKI